MSTSLPTMVAYLDEFLDIDGVDDASLNGLQVEAGATVGRVGLAVDACEATLRAAGEQSCDLLLVHHGLLFGGPRRLVGNLGRAMGLCFGRGVSLYAAHLPLDVHPEVGNNALLARALGAQPDGAFGNHAGVPLGVLASFPEPRQLADVAGSLASAGCDEQIMWAFGGDPVERIAVLTGSGCSFLEEAIAAGADCFVTGEPRHSAYHLARESGINCLFAGHYATEVFGVQAVGRQLADRFGVETVWIEHPTGV